MKTFKYFNNILYVHSFYDYFMGSSFPTGKYLISNEHVPPMLLGGWRFVIAGCMMLILTFMRNGERAFYPQVKGIVIKDLY